MTDPIADLLTRIRNAQRARHESVKIPYSSLKEGIVKALSEAGFLGPFRKVEGEGVRRQIEVSLRYTSRREPLISTLVRRSRSGRRVYLGYREIRPVRNGLGMAILSTPRGILTDRQAREQKVGGELICTVW